MLIKKSSLPPIIAHVVEDKGTEQPYTGEYDNFGESGTYLCRQCGLALFRSLTKFHSGCGWPSFDENIPSAILRETDVDGRRTEIICSRCHAHLGHVFKGEQFTDKNTRHCVNSLSLDFVSNLEVLDTEEAIFAAGCFWGVEYYLKKLPGVLKTEVGYTGGKKAYPTYEEVCSHATGHYEAIRVLYDPKQLSYADLLKYFFEIHDFTQTNGQGPDIGPQYLSAVFYYDAEQKEAAENVVGQLKEKAYDVATKILPVSVFWRAETYHLDYYAKTGKQPYCHRYEKIF
ncbi:MAG: bifunctional methionine sulfoxide reductase B/A protein [Gammaproteobacteria bacterium]